MGVLISIGRHEGPAFSVKLKAWDESGQDTCEEARYVRLTLARYLEKASKGWRCARGGTLVERATATPGTGTSAQLTASLNHAAGEASRTGYR